jgi:CHAT domain-containing protein
MDFHTVCDFFGGSIFAGELKGDFADAQRRVNSMLDGIESQSADEKAIAFLLQGIVFLLQGKHADSETWLEKLDAIPKLPARWQFRKASYQLFNIVTANYPPLGSPFHIQNFPVFDVWDPRYYPPSAVVDLLRSCRELSEHAQTMDTFERDLIATILSISTIGFRPSQFRQTTTAGEVAVGSVAEVEDMRLMLGKEQLSLLNLRDRAVQLNLPMTETFIERLILEANRSVQSSQFGRRLNDLQKKCEAQGDDLGIALCMITKGDNLVAGPHSHPYFLNMQVGETLDEVTLRGAGAYSLTPLLTVDSSKSQGEVEILETEFWKLLAEDMPQHHPLTGSDFPVIAKLDQIRAASRSYDQAELIYRQCNHLRGLGAIKLRRACLLMMNRSSPAVLWGPSRSAAEQGKCIQKLLNDASEMLSASGDHLLTKVVKVHRFIFQGFAGDFGEQVREMGVWAENNRSTMFLWCLGTFTHRLGDYYRYLCGSTRGGSCYEIARLLFLRCPTLYFEWFRCVDLITDFALSFGIFQVAITSIPGMLGGVDHLLARLRAAQRVNAADLQFSNFCDNIRWFLVQRLIRRVLSVYTAVGDFSNVGRAIVDGLCENLKDYPEEDELKVVHLDTQDLVEIFTARAESMRLLEEGEHAALDRFAEQTVESYTKRPSFDVLQECLKIISDISDDSKAMRDFTKKFVALDIQHLSIFHERRIFCRLNGASGEQRQVIDYPAELSLRERALELFIHIKAWKAASRFMADLTSRFPSYATSTHSVTGSLPWQRRLWAGLVSEHDGRYHEALSFYFQSWYFVAIDGRDMQDFEQRRSRLIFSDMGRVFPCIARLCIYLRTQRFRLPGADDSIARDDSFSLLSAPSDAHIPAMTADETAVEWLELGKARYTMDLLSTWQNSTSDSGLGRWLETNRKMTIWKELRSLGSMRTPAEEQEFQQLDKEAQDLDYFLIENVDLVSGAMHDTNYWYSFRTLRSSLPPDALVIYTAISQDGLALFGIDHTGILYRCWNPSVKPFLIRKAVSTYLGLINKDECEADIKVLQFISAYLSSIYIQPLARFIIRKDVIIFVPSGDIARFPLGTLLLDNRYLFPWKKICQVPSLSLYHYSRSAAKLDPQITISAISRPGSMREELSPEGLAALPMGGIEALHVSLMAGASLMNAAHVTRDQFRQTLQESSIVHVTTHGMINYQRPAHSYITLKEPFRILDLANVQSKASAVIFSTCFSGAGSAYSSGDLIGFSQAVLATGAKTYIGALWKARDVSTLIQMYLLYSLMPRQDNKIYLFNDAWHRANEILLSLDVEKATVFLKAILKEWDIMEKGGFKPGRFVRFGREQLIDVIEELRSDGGENLIDFQHPFIWAPFAVVGYADWGMRYNVNRMEKGEHDPVHSTSGE